MRIVPSNALDAARALGAPARASAPAVAAPRSRSSRLVSSVTTEQSSLVDRRKGSTSLNRCSASAQRSFAGFSEQTARGGHEERIAR